MGLDNGFTLRSRANPEEEIANIAYFRKYYELDDWMRLHCKKRDKNEEFEWEVTLEDLEDLRRYIETVAKEVIKLDQKDLDYYDNYGYDESLGRQLCLSNDFCPVDSKSMFPGTKLIRLYHAVNVMCEILDTNRNSNVFITFYSSF